MNFSPALTNHGNFNDMPLSQQSTLAELCFDIPRPKSTKTTKKLTKVELVEAYTESRVKFSKSKLKNIEQDHQILLNVMALIPFEDLNELDRSCAENIRNALHFYPKNAKKISMFEGLEGFDLIFANQSLENRHECISITTVKGYIHKFSSLLNWAKSHNYIYENVFHRLPTLTNKHIKKRFPFNSQELDEIFSMEEYRSHNYLHPYYYWLPLLLRYTGARMNEICQAREEDITDIDGVACITFQEKNHDQSIKNLSSVRNIPLHNELIDKGILSFVQSRKGKRLFPELPLVNGYFSTNASKWFKRRRDKLGLCQGKDGHSFRHTFINELKQKGVSKEAIECIVGHAHNSQSFDTYSEQYEPKLLLDLINLIDSSHTSSIKPYFL